MKQAAALDAGDDQQDAAKVDLSKRRRSAVVVTLPPAFFRMRDVADYLAVSESTVMIFVRREWLTPIRIPDVRSTRFARAEVEELAQKLLSGALR